MEVLLLDDALPQRLCVTSGVEAPDHYPSLLINHDCRAASRMWRSG